MLIHDQLIERVVLPNYVVDALGMIHLNNSLLPAQLSLHPIGLDHQILHVPYRPRIIVQYVLQLALHLLQALLSLVHVLDHLLPLLLVLAHAHLFALEESLHTADYKAGLIFDILHLLG